MQQHFSKISDDELTNIKEDAGSLSLKYLYQSDNNMNKGLTHAKILVFYAFVVI